MTKKDFELIAAAFVLARAEITAKEPETARTDLLDGVAYAAEFVADALASTNPRFDLDRFLDVCGARS